MEKKLTLIALVVVVTMNFWGLVVNAEDPEDPRRVITNPKPPVVVVVPMEDPEDPR